MIIRPYLYLHEQVTKQPHSVYLQVGGVSVIFKFLFQVCFTAQLRKIYQKKRSLVIVYPSL